MAKTTIPEEIKQEMNNIIIEFNKKYFKGRMHQVSYFAEYKGKFLYLTRNEYGKVSPVVRLTWTGDKKSWDFAIFRWSSERYDPDEDFFPGAQYVDGTVQGAMRAGLEAYPV